MSKVKSSADRGGGSELVPKLRFPEFKDSDGWKEISLQKLASPVTDRAATGDAEKVLSLSGEHGLVLQSDFFGKKVAGDSTQRYLKIRKDDFVYNDRTTKASSYGTIKRLSNYFDGIVSPIYKCFRFQASENPTFWEWYFESGSHDPALARLVNEGARAGRFNISVTQFLSTNAWRPDEVEQQKIANCLASSDALIEAQSRKVELLKADRKGLIQQLFPQEGETQPRLRFPGFEGTGKWLHDTLGNLFDITSGGTPERTRGEYWNGGIPWVTTSLVNFNIITETAEHISEAGLKNSSAKIFPEKTILLAMYGQGKTRGQVAMLGVRAATNQACAAILPRKGIRPDFVFLNLSGRYDELRGLSNSGGQENLSQGLIKGLLFAYPSDPGEQQRIAHCLTSLDDVISAEIRKLDMLRTHKKGLMQQLFPSIEESVS